MLPLPRRLEPLREYTWPGPNCLLARCQNPPRLVPRDTQIQSQHASELKEGERRLAESRATCTAAEQRAKDVEEQLSTLRQAHLQSLHALERSVGQALVDAVSSARQRGEAA